jgi:uncharacterized protein YkwD
MRREKAFPAAVGVGILCLAGCSIVWRDSRPRELAIVKPELNRTIEDGYPVGGGPTDAVERTVFREINHERRLAGVPPVVWDEKAAFVARAYTKRQLEEGTYGHFLTDGVPPYARLARGGSLGVGSENVAAYFTDGMPLRENPETLALKSQVEMVSEKPPNDGHRRAILDPNATHVGIGWALGGSQFRLAEEFTSRHYDWLKISRVGSNGSSIRVKGKALGGERIEYVSVARQPAPEKMSPGEIRAHHTYSYPAPSYALLPASTRSGLVGLETFRCLVPSFQGKFSFQYQIDQPGLWTFLFYFKSRRETSPKPGASFSISVGEDGRAEANS